MPLFSKNSTTNTWEATMRFAAIFTVIYLATTFLFATLGVFELVQAEPEEETETEETAENDGDRDVEERAEEPETSDDEDEVEETQEDQPNTEEEEEVTVTVGDPRIPATITAPAIELEEHIVNPRSRDDQLLNDALLRGVTYYPRSGYLDQEANIFLLGHSSGFPVVANKNYKVFNRIKELEPGDPIYLEAAGVRYTYRVTKSFEAKDHEIVVDFKSDVPKLTLATCNVFGEREDRFIVEAVLAQKEKMR